VKRASVLSGATVALVGLGCMLAVLFLVNDHPTRVTGAVAGVRDVSFVEGGKPDTGISPVCGCESPPLNSWRGITFAGREVTLTRSGRSPWTQWALSSADPEPVSFMGGRDWLTITAVRFRLHGTFNPRWMLGDIARHVQVVSRHTFSAYAFLLLDHSPLHLAMLGPVPVGSWIPYPGSQVRLSTQPSDFPQDRSLPQMTERYPSTIGATSTRPPSGQTYPLGDFLLPNLVVWSDDPNTQIPETPVSAPTNAGVVTALLLRHSTFSLRVAATPISNREFADLLHFRATHPAPRAPGGELGAYDAGEVKLTVDRPLSAAAYAGVRRHAAAQRVTKLRVLSDPFLAANNGDPVPDPTGLKQPPPPWRYTAPARYPPLPLYTGFNVWGPLRSVGFSNVSGHISVGDQAHDLSGAPDLTLSGVRGLRNANDQELLSAPLATSGQTAALEFRAVASVRINGHLETSWFNEHGSALTIATALLTLIGTIFGVLAYLRAIRPAAPGKAS
jgi:hypothetical protein